MKNAIEFMKAARRNRPNEQHLSIDTRLVDETIEGVESLEGQLFTAKQVIHDQSKNVDALLRRIKEMQEEMDKLSNPENMILKG